MRTPTTTTLALALSLCGAPAVLAQGIIPIGLELRDGAPPPARPASKPAPRVEPAPAPRAEAPARAEAAPRAQAAARSPVEQAVDEAMARVLGGPGGPSTDEPTALADGTPLSRRAQQVVDALGRAAGLDRGAMASVTDRPRDQARFLVEQMFDPAVGEARVTALYGLPGSLAAESYRRLRDRFQVLDLSPAQRETVVAVVEAALVIGEAIGQVQDPAREWIDIDPGARADRDRFERAVAGDPAIARCLRPSPGGNDRVYLIEIPRDGTPGGGARCHAAWAAPVEAAAMADSGGSEVPARSAPPPRTSP